MSKSAMQQIMVDMKEILHFSQVAVIHSLSHVNSSTICVEAAVQHESILEIVFFIFHTKLSLFANEIGNERPSSNDVVR